MVKIGDVVEFQTSIGKCYAIYTHKHVRYGALLRVFEKIYKTRPKKIGDIVSNAVQFSCFFPLGSAVSKGIVTVVGNVAVPAEVAAFPIFRDGVADPRTGKVSVWWLWDGEKEWRVENLTPEQRKMPIRGIWNDTLLIERVISGWTSDSDNR
ncbi:Uncharacterized protein MLTONO_5847 [Mesorhizobium loti]|nr:Uncharacterized protein MLTONO_5847 [Mesorhizobium loti]